MISTKTIIRGAITFAAGAALWYVHNTGYTAGVEATTATFLQADIEGANNVRETAQEILDSIDSDADPDELLARTGGLRD